MSSFEERVDASQAGQRLDVALAASAGISRSQARRWIEQGLVRVNDHPVRASARLDEGDRVSATAPEPAPSDVVPEATPLDILFEDADVVVIDKPAGMVVHPAPGHTSGTLVHGLLHHCGDLSGIGGILRPGIVHRLDRGTSGVLVAAKNDRAHRFLAEQFHDHTVERVYRALVRGVPASEQGEVAAAIGRHPTDRKRMSVRTRAPRAALTRFRVARRFARSGVSLLEVRPETGRTHQIRVHLASAGLPILGDPVYGARRKQPGAPWATLERPALHAAVLGFDHPTRGERMRFEAPLPADLADLVERLDRAERRA